mgnify:CR=1 FL=1
MKSIPKLIRRFIGVLLLSAFLLLLVNFVVLGVLAAEQTPGASPWTTASETAEALTRTANGYVLSESIADELEEEHVWGILIDNASHKVIWQTENLPQEIPLEYTLSDVAYMSRGYVKDYPTFTGEAEDGVVVLGYPKDRYWKQLHPSWDYNFIANVPKIIVSVLLINVTVIFLIYVAANTKLLKSVKPITEGIQALPTAQHIHVREQGRLSELSVHINQTSEIIEKQNRELRKKETARANWIAGVSHDIRTPLSVVMGYAGQMVEDTALNSENQKKAAVILKQSEKMKDLINDLNLASKLEYNMQPLQTETVNAVALARQVAADFINMEVSIKFPILWQTEETLNTCLVQGDKALLKRAVTNLIQNSIHHNPNGCRIYICVAMDKESCILSVEDDGAGVTDAQLEKLSHMPHYMMCDSSVTEQQHGLGLLLVKQIAESHHGQAVIEHSVYGGFAAKIILPLQDSAV